MTPVQIVFLGLSITSSWGNGHATTYRGLVRQLARRGHRVLFLERDMPWYAANRDLPNPPYGSTALYDSLDDLKSRFAADIERADLVVVGSYVPEGVAVANWVLQHAAGATAFYDIDTPVTLQKLARADYEYISPELVPRFDLYLSFNGGPVLQTLEREWGARRPTPLYCSADLDNYFPEPTNIQWDLGYMGTYSPDRQTALDRLLIQPAKSGRGRFIVAGPSFPAEIQWPSNVQRIEHLAPAGHRAFYNAQRYTLNVTRAQMVSAGYAPSIRIFEAAACATPIISDWWHGLDDFFVPGQEIFVSTSPEQTLHYLWDLPAEKRLEAGRAARQRVLLQHSAAHRAAQLEACVLDILNPSDQNIGTNVRECESYGRQ